MAYGKDEDFDWRVALCLGLGMTQEQTAEYLGCVRQTIGNHLDKNSKFFDRAINEVQTIKARAVTPVVNEVIEVAEERIKKLFNRAFAITEKVVSKAEGLGDDITLAQALEIHKSLTQWAAKFAASEAPRRVQLEGKVQHNHVQVPAALFAALEGVMREQKLLPPDVLDAEVVDNGQPVH